MNKEEWFLLYKQKTQEIKNITKKQGKIISDDKAKYLAKQVMPEFPNDGWDDI